MPCVAGEKCNNKVRLDVLLREEENEMPMSMQYCYLTPKKMNRCDCLGGAYAPYSILNLVAYVNEMYRHRNTLTRKNSKRAGSYKKHEVYSIVLGRTELIIASISEFLLILVTLILTVYYNYKNNYYLESEAKYQERINKIQAKDGNHMILITAIQEDRKRRINNCKKISIKNKECKYD